ncbi:hypothetical protein [Candidatus Thiosymbion oneisti]|uniref:hypothetical protein n=1 Tax=Candidatus Thiosymbion oneisti TaxID=589554 RepID=UPI00114CE26C|nr:hypothetical protein [Candidatus Thiosymbion oneisti]
MHGRAKSCDWEWDSFIYQYIVFDAIYKFHVLTGQNKIQGHKNRLYGLCNFYGIKYEAKHIENIYRLRNDLFHEALWNGSTPGYSIGDARLSAKWLENLNSRLIVSLAGYKNGFSSSGWWFFGWQLFEKYEPC